MYHPLSLFRCLWPLQGCLYNSWSLQLVLCTCYGPQIGVTFPHFFYNFTNFEREWPVPEFLRSFTPLVRWDTFAFVPVCATHDARAELVTRSPLYIHLKSILRETIYIFVNHFATRNFLCMRASSSCHMGGPSGSTIVHKLTSVAVCINAETIGPDWDVAPLC